MRKVVVNIARLVLAIVLTFSGFVKAVDPMGTQYKIADYLTAMHLNQLAPEFLTLGASVLLSAVEFGVGICLLFGIRKTISTSLAVLMMLFMTPLSLWLALADPIQDCGCFGDAVVLTNWQTFCKNIVLLAMACIVRKWPHDIVRFISTSSQWIATNYSAVFILALSGLSLYNLPYLDFRPYRIGTDLRTGNTSTGIPQRDTDGSLAGRVGYDVLEIGPGMGVLTQYLLEREDINLKMVELDEESVNYLLTHLNGMQGRLWQADYLKLDVHRLFDGPYRIIGNFPYNISSQIFFKILDDHELVPEVVCMIQKEVAERIAEGPGSKTYGILSVLLQAWYDIEYLFTVEPGAFAPPPKVRSAVIRLRRNARKELQVEEKLFRAVVKTAFNQRRKTLRNALKPLLNADAPGFADFIANPVFDLRAERLGVDDFISLTASCTPLLKCSP